MPRRTHQLSDVTPYVEQLQSNLTRIADAIIELDKRTKRLEEQVRVLALRSAQQEVIKAEPGAAAEARERL